MQHRGSLHFKAGQLNLEWIKQALFEKKKVLLDKSGEPAIHASHALIQKIVHHQKPVYGINTGFGGLAHQRIDPTHLKQLQRNLLLSHACGCGELLSDEIVALILLLKVNCLARGASGVRKELIDAFLALYNAEVYPCVPAKGSVGASGDLAPLAHLALPLIGEGEVRYKGEIISAKEGLTIAGIKPIALEPKEGLALLNGLQVSAALCLMHFFYSERLFETAILAGALSVEAARGHLSPFDARIQEVRGHQTQSDVARMFRELLKGSTLRDVNRDGMRIQDPYSLRCQPQIMGAVLHQMQFVGQTLQVEVNSVTDNPLIFPEEQEILSGGNFHGEMLAMAADNLAIAIAEIGSNAERRIALLIDNHFSGLPAFLVKDSGLNSGFMVAHYTAAACASENKSWAHPHSVDSIPTSANQEDHVSMATGAALRLHGMLENTATILAIELLAACQGLDFHAPLSTSATLQTVYNKVRKYADHYEQDRYFAPDIVLIKQAILNGEFAMNESLR